MRQRLRDGSATARQQVDLLREIARQQAHDILQKRAEITNLEDTAQRAAVAAQASALAAAAKPPVRGLHELEAQVAAERAKVERLRRELQVWRAEGGREGFLREGGLGASSAASVREAERQLRRAMRAQLERELEDLRERCAYASAAAAAERDSGLAASLERLGGIRGEAVRLQEELLAEQRAAKLAWERTSEIRHQIEAARRAQAGEAAKTQAELDALSEEAAQAERRLEAERELEGAQKVQLRSVRDAADALRTQLQHARRENDDVRRALQETQATFQRLRQ